MSPMRLPASGVADGRARHGASGQVPGGGRRSLAASHPSFPHWLGGLMDAEERFTVLPSDAKNGGRLHRPPHAGGALGSQAYMVVEVSRLSNGLTVATETLPNFESVALGIWVKSGARNERDDEHGIAHLLEHMAFKGTAPAQRLGDRLGDRECRRRDQRRHQRRDHLLLCPRAERRRAAGRRHPGRHPDRTPSSTPRNSSASST